MNECMNDYSSRNDYNDRNGVPISREPCQLASDTLNMKTMTRSFASAVGPGNRSLANVLRDVLCAWGGGGGGGEVSNTSNAAS